MLFLVAFEKVNDLKMELRPIQFQKDKEADNIYIAFVRQIWWSDIYVDSGLLFLVMRLTPNEDSKVLILNRVSSPEHW